MSKSTCMLFAGAFALTVFTPPAVGSVDILSPGNGECVTLLPEPQRRIMALPTYEERLRAFREDKERGGSGYFDRQDAKWRTSLPLVLKWRATDDEKGPWRIALGRSPAMEDAVVWWVEDKEMEPKESDSGTLYCWTVPRPNLEPGASYYWKIWSDVKCRAAHCHGSMMSGSCPDCGRKGKVHESDVFRFTTDPQTPRWIDLEGRVENVRDIGGWRTVDGRRVKFGMAFRGQGLNDNSANGEAVGKSRLMVEDVSYMKDVLHVKTDLDLRNSRETAGMTSSPLGGGVSYIQRASPLYNWIFENPRGIDQFGSEGKRTMAANFRVFCDERNYPIYFHCIGGADRTGSLAYVLNGVLGVPRHDLEVDWESTFYPTLPEMSPGYSGTNFWRRIQYFEEGFSRYGDENATWNERIRLYLLDCGITDEEIDRFRSIMLEAPGDEVSGGALSASLYDAVDPFVGSAGLGHVTPAACAPFGSVQAGPDTSSKPEKMECDWAHCGGYQHGDEWLWRFSQTHVSGTGCPSLGDIAILPYVKGFDGESRPVRMLKDTEKAKPGRYSVTVDAGGRRISCEIAALGHSALYRFTFPKGAERRLLLDLDWGIAERWKGDSRETLWNGCWGRKIISCTNEFRSAACAVGGRRIFNWTEYRIFYAAEFSSPSVAARKVRSADGMQGDVYALDFGRVPDDVLEVRIGISFTSAEAALSNLRSETKGLSFDAALAKGESLWRDALGCVELGGDCPREAAVNFASALYRTMVQPNTISDAGKPERYSTLSMWDTFRAAHPLYTIVAPERVDGFVNSMLDQFDRLGYLPIWGLAGGDTHCMVGHHSVPVIVDAWLKGFRGFDSERAWKAVENSLRVNHKAENVGTWGLLKEDWDVLDGFGYYPFDRLTGSWGDKKVMGESVSRTLECSYDDACASRFAKALGKKQEAEFFYRRSHSWTNLFDRSLMLMRGKDSQGRWREPFDPFENGWGAFSNNDLTEGNAWQYTWHVLQDPAGLVRMFGGRESFARRLDMLFRQKEVSYGHETPDVTGLIGQYAHGNEPSHHIAYLYQYAGRPERTAEVVREVFDKFYLAKPDGLSGNDDCGQMSAWHVFSAMGFYPLDPCGGEYVLGAPQLPKVVLNLESPTTNHQSPTFTIIAKNLSPENKYVKSVTLNGKQLAGRDACQAEASCSRRPDLIAPILRHSDIIAGGELVFEMTDESRASGR